MKKSKSIWILTTAILGFTAVLFFDKPMNEKERFSKFLKEHPFNNRERNFDLDEENELHTDRPDLAAEQDFLRTMNPALGRPTPENIPGIIRSMRSSQLSFKSAPGSSSSPWIERGPNNVGGRTRTLVWDPNDATHKKVWAGGITGGLWYNNDITSSTSSWISVNDFWADLTVSCMAFDPNNSLIAYVGTGERYTNSGRGAGIWKTTDGGITWNQLSSTTAYYYVNDIVVRNESSTSVVYAAVDAEDYMGNWFGTADAGLKRSTNGGTSWTQVLPNISGQTSNYVASNIKLSASNRIWVGSKSNPYGVGGGTILYSDNGTTWTVSNTTSVTGGYGRVAIACAPSNDSVIYALIEDQSMISAIKTTTDKGATWNKMLTFPGDADASIPSSDFTRGQAEYDLVISVDPNNASTVICGGIDLFESTDGAGSWTQISQWKNMGAGVSVVHADQHNITFMPGSSSAILFGCDGGIYYSSNGGTTISARNNNYNVTQFYACAMHPTSPNFFLAGAQDNGSQKFTSSGMNSTTQATGGDGAYCFIDQNLPSYQITSYIYNSYYLSTNGGTSFNTNSPISSDQTHGRFINPAAYDNNMHILYSAYDVNAIQCIKGINGSPVTPQIITVSGMADFASHIKVSPYTTSSSTLFIGTEGGKLFKMTNANNTPVTTNITSSSFPAGSISCVDIGASENELLVTFFNYGVVSVWYTSDGGTTWVNKENNLPDMPVRWALFNPNNRNEVLLATEVGVWATTNFYATSPNWASSNGGLANVRVDMLQYRASDKQVIAATYGRGLFSSNGFSLSSGVATYFTTSSVTPCLNQTVTLTDTSGASATSWTWTITPSSFIFVNGTTANSQNPQIQFTSSGYYNVSLALTNASGPGSLTKNNYIYAGGFLLPFTENWENAVTYPNWQIINPDTGITWNTYYTSGNGSSTISVGVDNFDYTTAQSSVLRDGLISPPLRLAGYSSASLTFKHAYRRYSPAYQDSMAVYVSTDCGSSWIRVASYRETQTSTPFIYITNSDTTGKFTPKRSLDWCGNSGYSVCKTINLTPYIGSTIRIKFENISGYGNNLYLDDITVSGVSNMPAPSADFSANNTSVCSGSSVSFTDLTTNNPLSWSWSASPSSVNFVNGTTSLSQNPVIQFTAAGSYTITLTSANTNTNSTKTKTNYITVTQSTTPTITISATDSIFCSGKSVTFNTSIQNGGTPVYQWKINGANVGTNSSSFISTTLNNNDTVSCVLTSNAVCASPLVVTSNKIKMSVGTTSPPVPTIQQSGNILTCNETGVSYQWYISNSPINNANNQTYTITQTGVYKVSVANAFNCSSMSADYNCMMQGIALLNGMSGFSLFPNPAKDIVYLQFILSKPKTINFTLYDISGKKVFEETNHFASGQNSPNLNLWFLPKGVYQIRMNDNESVMIRQVVIE